MRKTVVLLLILSLFAAPGCTPFMIGYRHGATNREALNKYHLVEENNFGGKRLRYCEEYFNHTAFDAHIKKYGKPDLVYEYRIDKKNQGIKLYYLKYDSVYIFASRQYNFKSIALAQTEKISEAEKTVYNRLAGSKK